MNLDTETEAVDLGPTAVESASNRMQVLITDYGLEMVEQICNIFCDGGEESLKALDKTSAKLVGNLAHRFRSSAKNLGLTEFAEFCYNLEEKAEGLTPQNLYLEAQALQAGFEVAKNTVLLVLSSYRRFEQFT